MAQHKLKIEDLTGLEIMHHVLLWCYNWTQEDFKKAFKDSKIGWNYHWNKLQGKCRNDINPTQAIVEVILNMDDPHQTMLFNFLFEKYSEDIQADREWKIEIEQHMENLKKEHRAKAVQSQMMPEEMNNDNETPI